MPEKEITLEHILSEIIKTRDEVNNKIVDTKTELMNCIEASEARILVIVEDLKKRIDTLEQHNKELQSNFELVDRNQRKKNIIVFGTNKPVKERSIEYFCREITKLLGIETTDSDISDLYSLGRSPNSPLKVELSTYHKKRQILQNCRKLKNHTWVIVNDLTKIQQQENKYLKERLNYYKNNTSKKVYIKSNKLFIENKLYTVEKLKSLEYESFDKSNSAPPTPTKEGPPEEITEVIESEDKENTNNTANNARNKPASKSAKKFQEKEKKTHCDFLTETSKGILSTKPDIRDKLRQRHGSFK